MGNKTKYKICGPNDTGMFFIKYTSVINPRPFDWAIEQNFLGIAMYFTTFKRAKEVVFLRKAKEEKALKNKEKYKEVDV